MFQSVSVDELLLRLRRLRSQLQLTLWNSRDVDELVSELGDLRIEILKLEDELKEGSKWHDGL